MAYKIIAEKCIQCDACRLECPRNAITNAEDESTYVIDQEKCNSCANMSTVRCVPHCPVDAIVPA